MSGTTMRRRVAFSLVGALAGLVVGLVFAAIAAWVNESPTLSPVTVAVGSVAFSLVGLLRGNAIGDLAGMSVYAPYQIFVPWWGDEAAPKGTYRPITLLVLLGVLALIAAWAA
jgi:hypothetical protein